MCNKEGSGSVKNVSVFSCYEICASKTAFSSDAFFFQFDREQRRARNASDPLVAKRKGPREAKRRGETSRSCSPSRLPLRGNLHQEGELWEGGRW